MDLIVQSPDELLAAVPHVLGFKPEESIVLVPFRPGLPITRVDARALCSAVWSEAIVAWLSRVDRAERSSSTLATICSEPLPLAATVPSGKV